MSTIRITIKVRKYLWKEVVRDVLVAFYTPGVIANALSERYLKHSIPDVFRIAKSSLIDSALFLALLFAGLVSLAFTAGIPIVLVLAMLGKIK